MTYPTLGQVLGGYRLDELAGRGGMGVVYRATQVRLERVVALKVITPELASDPAFRERFRREARLLAAVDDPHVVPVYDVDEADGQLFLSMRWIEGGDLAGEIARTGGLETTRAQGLLTQVATGLDAVPAHGLVHGDLKPANMLIEPRGAGERAYLSDFGAGRSLEATASGNWLGTVDYVGPETIRGAPPDPRADRYALACVLFEALTAGRGHRGGGGLLAAAATSKSQDERSGADEQSGASRHEHERIVHRPERLRRTSSRSTARSSREITRQRDG